MTRGLYRFNFFISLSNAFIPANVPSRQNNPTKKPYSTSSIPYITYVVVDAPVENIIMYIPVADAT